MRLVRFSAFSIALALFAGVVILFFSGLLFFKQVAALQGKTTDEIMQYILRRLEGHPNLEFVAHPILRSYDVLLEIRPKPQAHSWVVPPVSVAAQDNTNRNAKTQSDPKAIGQGSPILRVGPSQIYRTIGSAIQSAKSGSIIEVEPGNYFSDTGVILDKSLTIRAIGSPVVLNAQGASAERKGILIVRNSDVTVEGLTFIGATGKHDNGAAIRLDSGSLIVRRCLFHGNGNGILTSSHRESKLLVENSEFSYNGFGDGFTHSIYTGRIARVQVIGSYFHNGYIGHHIKSRAQVTEVIANRITDESGGRASYELDFPNGGEVVLAGNIVQQGRDNFNSTLVSYGAEGYSHVVNRLVMLHNTVVNDHPNGGAMLRVAPGQRSALVASNLWVGVGQVHADGDPIQQVGNRRAQWTDFVRPSDFDYRLREPGLFVTEPLPSGVDLPVIQWARYEHRARHQLMRSNPHYSGAW